VFTDLSELSINGFIVLSLHSIVRKGKQTRTYWNCKCKCDNTVKLRADAIRKTIACNCSRKRWIDTPLEIDGTIKTPREWARYYGIKPSHIYDRLKNGMPPKMAVSTPVGRSGVRIT
jgi:hypothetical protein